MTASEEVLDALKLVAMGAGAPSICVQVDRITRLPPGAVDSVLVPLFESWPDTSGCTAFPVEGTGTDYLKPDLWNPDTERGRRRRRLLHYLITSLEERHAR